MNQLYFGDCLDILKDLHAKYPAGFIDLIYIDPPFNSKRNYNILFEDISLHDTKAQKQAFADTWSNVSYKDTLEQIKGLDLDLFRLLDSFDKIRISKGAVSYLTTMAIRIWYMHKVLNSTGSFYLHCDPTMSHYLKIVCDLIFGGDTFRNEIIWHYRKWPTGKYQFQRNHDIILFYSRTNHKDRVFNQLYMERAPSTLKRFGKSKIVSGHDETGSRIPSQMADEESEGVRQDDVWDIGRVPPIKQLFPTEKPIALLDRIVTSSSNEDDLVADFFCGCGTTIESAQKLKRRWFGADISHLAIGLIEKRLIKAYPKAKDTYEIHGFPQDIASAHKLAEGKGGRFEFQDWIIESKLRGVHNPKKTADGGWDGHTTFDFHGKKEIVLVEVKSGHVNVKNLREFVHVVDAQKASIGVMVCFAEQVTKPMLLEAKNQGYYRKDLFGSRYDKIQILTVEDLLDEKEIQHPVSTKETFKTAEIVKEQSNQEKLF